MPAANAASNCSQEETKKDMDLIQPGNVERMPKRLAASIAAFKQGKTPAGRDLTDEEKKQVQQLLPGMEQKLTDLQELVYQSPTLTFKDRLDIDLGNRDVQVLHLGRGNTPGDAIVYLPKEKILAAGDLLVHPIPYTFDGYPSEWVRTLTSMAQMDPAIIVPGHGPVLRDKAYLNLMIELLSSTVDQVRARIRQLGHPGGHTVDEVKGFVDLSSFRSRFAGGDKDIEAAFDNMITPLLKITFNEAALR